MRNLHPVKKWLTVKEETQQALAERAGLSEGYLSNIIRGKTRCGAAAARKIVDATDGGICFEDLLR